MTTLRKAQEKSKLAQFIAEREAKAAPDGGRASFNLALQSMAWKSKEAPAAPEPRPRDN